MNRSPRSARIALAWAVCTIPFAATVLAQSPADTFHKAYYLQHEARDLQAAQALYEQVAQDQGAPAELRDQATAMLRTVAEELASLDFAQLMPADTILYLECNRPGEQLRSLLGQLGVLGGTGQGLGISPALVDGVLGMRGAAVAITEIDPRRGPTGGVAIVHPGDLDVVRGLLETALPIGGQRVEPIGGHATYSIEGQAFVTLTSRLLIAGRHREDIAGVVERMQHGGDGSLAKSQRLAGAMAMRGDDLMFFCVNLQPLMPMIMDAVARETRRDPGARAALAFLDLASTRTVAGRVGVDARGLSLDAVVELDEGHRNLAFNLLRLPNIDEQALSLVPSGPAFFCLGAINRSGAVPPGETDAAGRRVVTMMDFGRELFANVVDVAAFVMPEVQQAPWGPMPDFGVAMRVNDPQRSLALWQFVLGTAQGASGGGEPAAAQRQGDVVVQRFQIDKVPVFLAQAGQHLVLSPSERLIGSAVDGLRNHRSVLQDDVYADALALAGDGSTLVAAANLGRCGVIGRQFLSDRERREAAPFLDLLANTSVSFVSLQTATRCGVRGRVVGLPDVGPLLQQLIDRELHRGRRQVSAQDAPPRPARGPAATTGAPEPARGPGIVR
ncbi:MAG TPA: hypothetical protein VFZ65_12830 [Planctomycetota bacterium]|nr:hypothetical protein [Planctomycetota bacterium]